MDWKKKYETALEKATDAHNDTDKHIKATIERIFPELTESEDERIRESLVALIKEIKLQPLKRLEDWDGMLAYLEKQKDSFDTREPRDNWEYIKEFCDKFGRIPKDMDELDVLVSYVMNKKQKEQKPADDIPEEDMKQVEEAGYVVMPKARYNELVKPAEWSEEEKARIDRIVDVLDWAEDNGRISYSDWEDYVMYVKTLRPHPVAEWSEEDENYLEEIIDNLKFCKKNRRSCKNGLIEECIDWLNNHIKFFRAQTNWKPSEEQMEALEQAKISSECGNYFTKDGLKSLYEDLKKL